MDTEDQSFEMLLEMAQTCIEKVELQKLLKNTSEPVCLDGFEPTGRIPLAQGLLKIINVKKLIAAGCKVKIVVADWFALLNNRFGGNMDEIRAVGLYMIEVWKAAGLNLEGGNPEFLWASEEISSRAVDYWPLVMDIASRLKLPRVTNCIEAVGLNKQGKDEITVANVLYVCMQCADVFFYEADICHMGMDQHNINLLARESCDARGREKKPILLSHCILPGLQIVEDKMSKNHELSCIFMDDDEREVNKKIDKAFCPPLEVQRNPLIDYLKFIVFPWFHGFVAEASTADSGKQSRNFKNIEEVVACYEKGFLHPADLKAAVKKALNKILQPIRDHFKNDSAAKELLDRVKKLTQPGARKSRQTPRDQKSLLNLSNSTSIMSPHGNIGHQLSSDCSSSSSVLSFEEKFQMVRSIGEECIQEEDLKLLLKGSGQPICYDGFEPSGRMHIAQGVMKIINVNKITTAGCKVKIWIADWFAKLNNKMGGDLDKIKMVGEYVIEVWKAVGLNLEGENVEFLWASQEINSRPDEYWSLVMDIARRKTVTRIKRCVQIMGRNEEEELTAAQLLYPCMQCADIFFLKADICQMGTDQRKVNVLAREYCDDIKRKKKPVILSHHMLPGLRQGQEKMSKSNVSSAIFMEDDEDDIVKKIESAHCPAMVVEGNACLEYVKHLIFPWFGNFVVERSADHGGKRTFNTYEEVVADYMSGVLVPSDVKYALSKSLNLILQPVRDHFLHDSNAKHILATVKGYTVTK